MRVEYETKGLRRVDLSEDPFIQFRKWFEDAVSAQLIEVNAMVLSTVDETGQPWSRHVLLKGYDEFGFVFFTNYMSDKSKQVESNPKVCLTFSWLGLHRQVHIAGSVRRVSAEEADNYWRQRSRLAKLGSAVSSQSESLVSRQELLGRFEKAKKEYPEGSEIERPAHWGGWRVIPESLEFWQGRSNRLHDRFCYRRDIESGVWHIERLSP